MVVLEVKILCRRTGGSGGGGSSGSNGPKVAE